LTGVSAIAPQSFWEGFVRAARPAGIWVCVVILAVRGAVLPLLQFYAGRPVDQLDWMGVAALAVQALGLSAFRSFDKREGTA
jgi:hypothetical protein